MPQETAMTAIAILETVIYVDNLDAAEEFYGNILGLTRHARAGERHVFFRCDGQMLLIFNPAEAIKPAPPGALPLPPHGAIGVCHVCFKASAEEIEAWRARLEATGVAIEADFAWPQGGRSIYFRDPAGNCLEFAEPRIWGL
jgi:catechol 2,3-dioxygenase-like lactoylglutathione lyase family enzyme